MENDQLYQSAQVIRGALLDFWAQLTVSVPKVVVAAIIFLLGLLAANVLKTAVVRAVKLLKVDELMERIEVRAAFEKIGLKLDVAELLGWLIKWFVIILALIATADVLAWDQITIFLTQVVNYLPNVLIAVVILLVGFILGNFVSNALRGAFSVAKMETAGFLATVAKWAIIVFSFMAALVQLGIAASLINTLFIGFVAMVSLAGGLAFGLGGRAHASKILDHLYNDLRKDKQE